MIKTNKPITYDDFASMTPTEFNNFNIDIDLYTDEEFTQMIDSITQLEKNAKKLPLHPNILLEEEELEKNMSGKDLFKKYEIQ